MVAMVLTAIFLTLCSFQMVSADFDWDWGMPAWYMPWAWQGPWGGLFNNNNNFNNVNNFWAPNPFLSTWLMHQYND